MLSHADVCALLFPLLDDELFNGATGSIAERLATLRADYMPQIVEKTIVDSLAQIRGVPEHDYVPLLALLERRLEGGTGRGLAPREQHRRADGLVARDEGLGMTSLTRQGIASRVIALTPLTVLLVPVETLDRLVEADRTLARDFGREVDNRRARTLEAFSKAGYPPPPGSRLIAY